MDQLPKTEETSQDHNTSDLTIAPESELMVSTPNNNQTILETVLPPLPTTPVAPTTKVSFDPPQNWGSSSQQTNQLSSTESQVIAPPLPQVSNLSPEEPASISVIKIFLISLGLILLGVLLGVLAAKFFQPTQSLEVIESTVSKSPEASPSSALLTPIVLPTPTATPEALLKLNWKTFTNNAYKLSYPSTWTRKSLSNGISLTKGTSVISILSTKSTFECDGVSVQGFVKDGYTWDLQEASKSSQYQLCETTENQPTPNTSIGSVSMVGSKITSTDLDEFKYIIEKVEIVESLVVGKETSFVCPASEYIDCMPKIGSEKNIACSAEAMSWYKSNCPNFKGAAL